MRLVSDLETNGLLDTVTVIHCIVNRDPDTGDTFCFHNDQTIIPCNGSIEDGLAQLNTAEVVYFHNGVRYDMRVIEKLFPGFTQQFTLRDTLILSRMIWPEIKLSDLKKMKRKQFPGKLVGRYSLEAWGHRLGNYKGDYKGGWETFSQEMLDYCVQDISVTCGLLAKIEDRKFPEEAIALEHRVTYIMYLQEQAGFHFNTEKAAALYSRLVARKSELAKELAGYFPNWEIYETFIPKVNNKSRGYVKGMPFKKVKTVVFNPGSRDHIADRLKVTYGWKPTEFTDGGKAQIDEVVLKDLPYPCAPTLLEYLLVEKRIGQIAEGQQAWLRSVKSDGCIHGGVNPQGTVTLRMTHMSPNISQVPKVGSAYGGDCRELFEAAPGKKLVGIDAAGIQLRALGHYLAKWDDGEYARLVIEGKEDEGTDVHSQNATALGFDPKASYTINGKQQKGRNAAKTFIYAFVLGAGDDKVRKITGKPGRATKNRFLTKFPAIKELKGSIVKAVAKRGGIVSLDGRLMKVRSDHMALASLLQGFEAVIMKWALVSLYDALTVRGYAHNREYSFVANIHDEWQIECNGELAEEIGKEAAEAITRAGEHFNIRCRLDGNYKVGNNWKETH